MNPFDFLTLPLTATNALANPPVASQPINTAMSNPTLQYAMPGGPSYIGQNPFNGGLSSPQNSAGAGLQAYHKAVVDGNNAPLPPPRPPQVAPQQPSVNQMLQANAGGPWNSKQHGLIPNILHTFGFMNGAQANPLASLGQGIGNAVNGAGQGISNGLNGIFSGLFGGGSGDAPALFT